MRWLRSVFVLTPLFVAGLCMSQAPSPATAPAAQADQQALKAFAALHPIDAHVHVFKSDPAFQAMLERLNLKLLNILVMDDTLPYRKQLQPQVDDALALMRSSRGHIAFCTTFDPYQFESRSFSSDSMAARDRVLEKNPKLRVVGVHILLQ